MDADRFVDLACLTYSEDEGRARRVEAEALLVDRPALVHESVHVAAARGDVSALRAHLDRDPTAAQRRTRDRTALLALCYSRVPQQDALACLDLLLQRGADANDFMMIGECQFTALTGVIGLGEAGPLEQPPHPLARAMAERLLDAGADPNESQGLYNTHFLPDNDWLQLLLARGLTSEADLELLLGQAVIHGFGERVQILLAHGTSPDGRSRYNKRTHIENALLEGHAAIARVLMDAGAPAPAFDENDQFRVAVLANDALEARRLAASSSVRQESEALIAAARNGLLESVSLGLSLGLAIDARDADGLTALHHAARNRHLDVVRELVARGASLSIRDPLYNGTPLGHAQHFAAAWPRANDAEVLAVLEGHTP